MSQKRARSPAPPSSSHTSDRVVWFYPNGDERPTTARIMATRPNGDCYLRVLYLARCADVWVKADAVVYKLPKGTPKTSATSSSDAMAHEERLGEKLHNSYNAFMNPGWVWKKESIVRYRDDEKNWSAVTTVRNVDVVYFRTFQVGAHYYSPYPAAVIEGVRSLYICDFCCHYFPTVKLYDHHMKTMCAARHPTGDEIYRGTNTSGDTMLRVFELDGRSPVCMRQCQYLCLLGKLFLDHKTIITEVEDFVFYVLCEHDDTGSHVVGFFSKESELNKEKNNLSCLVVLPPYQGKGYGRLLVELSYELSKREQRPGTPEQPLTPAARSVFLSYWKVAVVTALLAADESGGSHGTSLSSISTKTGMVMHDVALTLCALGVWSDDYSVAIPKCVLTAHRAALKKCRAVIDTEKLRWTW